MKLEKEVEINELQCLNVTQKKYETDIKVVFKNLLTEEDIHKLIYIKNEEKIKLTLEVEKPVLDEAERKYLSGIIRPFKRKKAVIKIKKHKSIFENFEEIGIDTFYSSCGHITNLPPFKKGTMYKNMELNKEYTLKELGL